MVLCLLDYALFPLAVGGLSDSLATVLCLLNVPLVVESCVGCAVGTGVWLSCGLHLQLVTAEVVSFGWR